MQASLIYGQNIQNHFDREMTGKYYLKTRMHSSRMRTIRCSGSLSCHACPLPRTDPPSTMHAPFTTHITFPGHAPFVMHTPSVDRMIDACENITFPQLLLWTVKITTCEIVRMQASLNYNENIQKHFDRCSKI